MLKDNKGITLIALVITIIVLLILAGVSIAMLTGNNGILTQATNAAGQTDVAGIKEKDGNYIWGICGKRGDAVGKNMRALITAQYSCASRLLKNCSPNSMPGFYYRVLCAHNITCRALPGIKLTFPKYPLNTLHNAIPLKLSEIKICSRLVSKYYDKPEI